MADGSLPLFSIGADGVNVVADPVHLLPSEVTSAQNAEYSTDKGQGGIDQRPGMTAVNAAALASIIAVHDVPALNLTDLTPTLYAGLYPGSTHNWRKSTDGTTWANDDTLVKPGGGNTGVEAFWKRIAKVVTIGRYMYFTDANAAIGVHQWDGVNDLTLSTIPPAVSGTTLTAPTFYSVQGELENAGATVYTYKLVAIQGANHSTSGVAISVLIGPVALGASNYIALTDANGGANYQVPAGTSTIDVYRTVGGATQGKIGTIPIVAGKPSRGNGSGATGRTFQTEAPSIPKTGGAGATTYTYKLVHTQGTNHGAAGAGTTRTDGVAVLDSSNYITVGSNLLTGAPPIGNPTVDVYRTAGGATQGKIGTITYPATSLVDNGLVGDGTTAPVTGVGLQTNFYYPDGFPTGGFPGGDPIFSDAGLVADGTTAPVVAAGGTSANAISVIDMITDGTQLILAVLDQNNADPTVYGRILAFNPNAGAWTQVGLSFPIASGNGTAGSLAMYSGALSYATYIGNTTGNTSYVLGTGNPLPAGGVQTVNTIASPLTPACMAMFNGELYVGTVSLAAATAGTIRKLAGGATWTTSFTGPQTGVFNGFTSMCVFNGRLYVAYTPADTTNPAIVYATADGVTWSTDWNSFTAHLFLAQMVVFNSELYLVLGKTGQAFNTVGNIIVKRPQSLTGVWTTQDNPSDSFAGGIGVVYV